MDGQGPHDWAAEAIHYLCVGDEGFNEIAWPIIGALTYLSEESGQDINEQISRDLRTTLDSSPTVAAIRDWAAGAFPA